MSVFELESGRKVAIGLSFGLSYFASLSLAASDGGDFLLRALLAVPAASVLSLVASSSRFLLRSDPRSASRRPLLMMTLVAGAIVAALAHSLTVTSLADLVLGKGSSSRLFLGAAVAGALVYFAHFSYFLAAAATRSQKNAEVEVLSAELKRREMELLLLSSKFSPHFLFNALNSVAALTRKDPPKAYAMCVELGDFLRHSLGTNPSELSTLEEELEFSRKYLGIERTRYGERISYEERVEVDTSLEIPRFLLQPLFENAIKHGVSTLEGPTSILFEARKRGSFLVLSRENGFGEGRRAASSKVGLTVVRERLHHLSGGRASLRTESEPEVFRVVIHWPTESES